MTAEQGAALMQDPRTAEILDIVAKETGVPRAALVPQAEIAALDIASLDMVQAIFAIESKFDVEIPVVADKQGAEFTTVGELVAHVLATLDRKDAAPA
jgi:acyl carrier protein